MKHSCNYTPDQVDAAIASNARLSFNHGLYIIAGKNPGKGYWRVSYKFSKKRLSLSVGVYPETTIDVAIQRASTIQALADIEIDPSKLRQDAKSKGRESDASTAFKKYDMLHPKTFQATALAWLSDKKETWSESTHEKKEGLLRNHLTDQIGHRMLDDIEPKHIYEALRPIVKSNHREAAQRALWLVRDVFDFGIVTGRGKKIIPYDSIKSQLPQPHRTHFAATLNPIKLGEVLEKMNAFAGTYPVWVALNLLPMLLIRPGNLRQAEWSEFDLKNGLWKIPSEKMKSCKDKKNTGDEHIVPLSIQVIKLLRQLFEVTGDTGVLFPAQRGKGRFISDNTLNKALNRLGISTKDTMTSHGFRAVARTLLVEELGVDSDLIELQLDHTVPDSNGRAYNRTELIRNRHIFMQKWSDYLQDARLKMIDYDDPLACFTSVLDEVKQLRGEKSQESTAVTDSKIIIPIENSPIDSSYTQPVLFEELDSIDWMRNRHIASPQMLN